jgi:putative oxidoreductase
MTIRSSSFPNGRAFSVPSDFAVCLDLAIPGAMTRPSDYGDLFGRILLSLIFILSGINKAFSWDQTEAFLAHRGLPAPHVLLAIALGVEILGGLGLLFGRFTRFWATMLFLYLIPVTLVIHAFWMAGPDARDQLTHFLKNLAIIGSLLYVAAHGAGRFSIDSVVKRARHGEEPKIGERVTKAA